MVKSHSPARTSSFQKGGFYAINKSLVLKKIEALSRQHQMRTLWRNSFAQSSKRKGRQMRPHSEKQNLSGPIRLKSIK
jgi:hypothetical protein